MKGDQSVTAFVQQRKQALERKLNETGEMQKLQEFLRKKLIESGWKDDLKRHCKDIIRQKGMEEITIEELMREVSTRGKHTIQPKIKNDLVNRVKSFLDSHPIDE